MKVALVQDWLTELGGAEKVLTELHGLYPDADLFTLVASPKVIERLGLPKPCESFITHLPFARKWYRKYLQFFPLAIEGFDLSPYDLVISSSSSVAKGVLTRADQVHICYCHSPARYVWDLSIQYLREAGLTSRWNPLTYYVRKVLHHFRIWDVASANRVDQFVANSNYISHRIRKVYRRDSVVIYPPVNVDKFALSTAPREDFYFAASRMVSYKKMDVIVKAFAAMPNKQLYVAGAGPELKKIKKLVTPNVHLLGYVSDDVMKDYMSRAKAYVFAAEEDFGIAPVEAQACGTPVICFGKGGALETVIDGQTGVYFSEQTETAIADAVRKFESMTFDPLVVRRNSERFSSQVFRENIAKLVESCMANRS